MYVHTRGGGGVSRLPPPVVFGSSEIMTVECFVFLRPLGFGVFVSPGLDPVVVVVPRQKTKSGFGLEAALWCVIYGGVLTCFFFVWVSFFSVRSALFGDFFQDTRLTTVVAGFFWSCSLQPRQCRSFTLDAWPTRAREVSPWTGACVSQLVFHAQLVFHGGVGGFSVVPGSPGGSLLLWGLRWQSVWYPRRRR
jgi:hypothetical protein